MSAAGDLERRFLSTITARLVTLPYDLKVLFEAAADSELDRKARELAAGTILHVLGPNDASGDMRALGYVDDVVLLRLALRAITEQAGESAASFRARFAEELEGLASDLEIFRAVLGENIPWLESKLPQLARQVYKGKRVADYVDDPEASQFLYDAGLAFQTNYDLTEEYVAARIKRTQPILEHLAKRRAEDAKKITSG